MTLEALYLSNLEARIREDLTTRKTNESIPWRESWRSIIRGIRSVGGR